MLFGLALVAINFMHPILRTAGPLYVTLWYFMAAFVWTFLTYAMGSCGSMRCRAPVPAPLVGCYLRPRGIVRHALRLGADVLLRAHHAQKTDVESRVLAGRLLGEAGVLLSLNGIHHFLYTPIPMFLQSGAIISTIAVEMVVLTVIVNFFGMLWGSGLKRGYEPADPLVYTGMVFYAITCAQCALQTTLTFQALIHFSDWVVDAHLVMFRVFSMWLLGIMTYLFPLHR